MCGMSADLQRPIQASEDVDHEYTAGIVILMSFVAWGGEALVLVHLWLAHNSAPGASISLYVAPVMYILPWVAAMQWLRRVRRDGRSGVLDAALVSRCYSIIGNNLVLAYAALLSVVVACKF
jgi:hypothetical protein